MARGPSEVYVMFNVHSPKRKCTFKNFHCTSVHCYIFKGLLGLELQELWSPQLSGSGKAAWGRKATESHGRKADPEPKRNIKKGSGGEDCQFSIWELEMQNLAVPLNPNSSCETSTHSLTWINWPNPAHSSAFPPLPTATPLGYFSWPITFCSKINKEQQNQKY